MWSFSVSSFTAVIFIVTLRLMLTSRYFTWLNLFCIFFMSLGIYFAYVWGSNYTSFSGTYQSIQMIFSSPHYYLSVFVCVSFCYLIDLLIEAWRFEIKTSPTNFLRKLIHLDKHMEEDRLIQFDHIYQKIKRQNIGIDFEREEKLEEKRDLKTNKYGGAKVLQKKSSKDPNNKGGGTQSGA
jgi:Phospholipid-translocating P-type ATPase C-terminal